MRKIQILVIHGGETFNSYEDYLKFLKSMEVSLEYLKRKGWKNSLQKTLGIRFEVIQPRMPNNMNAKYPEWKIYFERYISLLNKEVVLAGSSLGGIFLAKYLSENKFAKKIKGTFLVAPPFDDKDTKDSLGDFILPKSLKKFERQGGKIFLYQSKDDPVVPFGDVMKYKKELPDATLRIFNDRGHSFQEKFPEIIKDIKSLFR